MALVNELLVARFNRQLTRIFGIRGVVTPVPQLAPDIQPGCEILAPPDEYRFLGGENVFERSHDIGAVGAQRAQWRIRNPANSGVFAVIDRIVVCAANTANTFQVGNLGAGSADLATTFRGLPVDSRLNVGTTLASTCITSSTTIAAGGLAGNAMIGCQAADTIIVPGPWILIPDQSFDVLAATVNLEVFIGARWRERALEPGELNLPA